MTIDPTTLRGLPLFASLEEPATFNLRGAVEKTYARGAVLAHVDEPADQVYFVLTGIVKETQRTPEGKEVILALDGPGELTGDVSLFEGDRFLTEASTIVPSRLLLVPREQLLELIHSHPRLGSALAERLARRLTDSWTLARALSRYTTEARLKSLLSFLSERWGQPRDQGVEIALDLTHRMLADMAGASREKVTRALGALERRGLISMSRRRVVVPSLERLATE